MAEVDLILWNLIGFHHRDLTDFPYRDAYDAGVAPTEVVTQLLNREEL